MSKPIRTTLKKVEAVFFDRGSSAWLRGFFRTCEHGHQEFADLGWELLWNPYDGRMFWHPALPAAMQLGNGAPEHRVNPATKQNEWMSNETLIEHYKGRLWGGQAFIFEKFSEQEKFDIPTKLSTVI